MFCNRIIHPLAGLGEAHITRQSPLLMPTNSGASSPRIDQIPDELRKIADELRATAAGQFVLRLYQENRPAVRPQSEIPENERGRSVRVGISDFLPLLGIKL